MSLYLKDKTNRITLRLNDRQFEYVRKQSEILGVSPSEYIRMLLNSMISLINSIEDQVQKEVFGRENDETDSDNLV